LPGLIWVVTGLMSGSRGGIGGFGMLPPQLPATQPPTFGATVVVKFALLAVAVVFLTLAFLTVSDAIATTQADVKRVAHAACATNFLRYFI
jgi:hypothetical protein